MTVDRNQHARDDFQARVQALQQQREKDAFALDVAAGKVALVDRLGKRLAPGQVVVFSPPPGFQFWQVAAVEAEKAPNVPAGVMRVTLTATVPLQYAVNRPVGDMLIMGAVNDQGQVVPLEPLPPTPDATPVPEPSSEAAVTLTDGE